MKVLFYCDDEPTEVDADLFNALSSSSWNTGSNPEEDIDGLTGEFAKVYKVYFIDGTEEYVDADMLAAIENGEYEIVEVE